MKDQPRRWSIAIQYDALDDDRKIRVRSVFQCEAASIFEAYQLAEKADWGGRELTFGAILPGYHAIVP